VNHGSSRTNLPSAPARLTGADAAVLAGCIVLSAWVQRHALGAFFSSPDDLVHLQQAAGLRPTLPSPFRWLSQVVYFRAMLRVFGLDPVPWHAATVIVHLLNVALVFTLVRRLSFPRATAGLTAAMFGCFPLFLPLLASAVGMNDELALSFSLIAMLALCRPGTRAVVVATIAFALAALCKESILGLPLAALAFDRFGRAQLKRVAPLLGLGVLFALLLLARPPQGLAPYTTALGGNLFHALMTFTAWAMNVSQPIPDLVSSYDVTAWHRALWVYPVLLVAAWRVPSLRRPVGVGLAWWIAGLLPVLPLLFQTFRHYLYPALPGFALACSGVVVGTIERLAGSRRGVTAAAAGVLAVAYALRADALETQRMALRVGNTPLALDPVQRRQEVARNALASFAGTIGPGDQTVVVYCPDDMGHTFGARSGHEYRSGAAPAKARYNLLEESLDGGRAVHLFQPTVDSVIFARRWSPSLDSLELFLPYVDGRLYPAGRDAEGRARAVQWMFEQGFHGPLCDYLRVVLERHDDEPGLRLSYAYALGRTGEADSAFAQLGIVIARGPSRDAAVAETLLTRYGRPIPKPAARRGS
jgi:hypothetical protein